MLRPQTNNTKAVCILARDVARAGRNTQPKLLFAFISPFIGLMHCCIIYESDRQR